MSQHPFNPDFSPLCVMIARDLIRQGIPLTNGIAVTISVAKTGNDGDPVDLRSIERVSQGRLSLDLSAEQGQPGKA